VGVTPLHTLVDREGVTVAIPNRVFRDQVAVGEG